MKAIFKNKYVRRARISEYKFRKMVKYFAEDLSATEIAEKIALNRNTVNRYLNEIRAKIVEFCEQYAPFPENSQVEPVTVVDETSAPKADSKLSLQARIGANLGFIRRRGKVYAEMLATSTASKLANLINNRNQKPNNLTIHAVAVQEEFGVIAMGYDNDPQYALKPSYVQDLDRFWAYIKQRTSKFQGLAKHKLYNHLKETEFRFNFRNDNLYLLLLQLLKTNPID